MHVRNTGQRFGTTLAHGRFLVTEPTYICSNGCKRKDGGSVLARPSELEECLPPHVEMGYDVMVFAGLQRFLHYQQQAEIAEILKQRFGVVVSKSEIGYLERRFLEYFERLHVARAPALKAYLQERGGWYGLLDGTTELGRGTLVAVLAGGYRWILGARKVMTERSEVIEPLLLEIVDLFEMPRALVRDLGLAVRGALVELRKKRGKFKDLSCHHHFLRDVGSDLLDAAHAELRVGFRRKKTRASLRVLARDLGRKLGKDINVARQEFRDWQKGLHGGPQLPDGRAGMAVVRGLCQWVLDYKADGAKLEFPFSQPYLDFFNRCGEACDSVEGLLGMPPGDNKVRQKLDRLATILRRPVQDHQMNTAARSLGMRIDLFERLRKAMRLHKDRAIGRTKGKGTAAAQPASESDLRDIKASVQRLMRSLKSDRPAGGAGIAKDRRKAIDIILAHHKRHKGTLWGHVIKLPEKAGGGVMVVDRTTNDIESHWGSMKHGERRRSGRKNLTRDMEEQPAAAAMVLNLQKPDYVNVLCGNLEALPAAFMRLDRDVSDAAGHRGQTHRSAPSAAETQTASLPPEDRKLIRMPEMQERLEEAANQRRQGGRTSA